MVQNFASQAVSHVAAPTCKDSGKSVVGPSMHHPCISQPTQAPQPEQASVLELLIVYSVEQYGMHSLA